MKSGVLPANTVKRTRNRRFFSKRQLMGWIESG